MKKEIKNPFKCPQCGSDLPLFSKVCPQCGYIDAKEKEVAVQSFNKLEEMLSKMKAIPNPSVGQVLLTILLVIGIVAFSILAFVWLIFGGYIFIPLVIFGIILLRKRTAYNRLKIQFNKEFSILDKKYGDSNDFRQEMDRLSNELFVMEESRKSVKKKAYVISAVIAVAIIIVVLLILFSNWDVRSYSYLFRRVG